MSRNALKFWAAVLGLSIVIVLFAGLDDLPRDVRHRIDGERAALASAQKDLQASKEDVGRRIAGDAALFSALPSAKQWPGEFAKAGATLESASRVMSNLTVLEKQNRRRDRDRAESLLREERGLRASAMAEASAVQQDAARWVERKQRLPEALQEMERNRQTLADYDLAAVTATVQKAEADWPEKKADLESRLVGVRGLASAGSSQWDATSVARRQAAAGDLATLDYAALLVASDQLRISAADLPARANDLKALSSQLYVSWDKVLVDMQTRGRGSAREYEQKIRTVRTQVENAASKGGSSSSEESWIAVPKATYQAMEKNLGMAIEHKPAGKYDSEAERVAQPAGFAYIAPPGQSNQYGYWDNRNGHSFWVFYGQYALMRDLLFGRDYRPLDRGEWDGYRSSQNRGQTYYGDGGSSQKYGTAGTATQERYSGSSYAQSGGFKDSKYATKSGSFRDSQYASPSMRQPDAVEPRTFGKRDSSKSFSPPSAKPFRAPSAPRSFRMPSAPRRFGKH